MVTVATRKEWLLECGATDGSPSQGIVKDNILYLAAFAVRYKILSLTTYRLNLSSLWSELKSSRPTFPSTFSSFLRIRWVLLRACFSFLLSSLSALMIRRCLAYCAIRLLRIDFFVGCCADEVLSSIAVESSTNWLSSWV